MVLLGNIGLAGWLLAEQVRREREHTHYRRTSGVITSYAKVTHTRTFSFEVSFEVDGRRYQAHYRGNAGGMGDTDVGSTYDVYYDPADPSRAEIRPPNPLHTRVFVLVLMVALFIASLFWLRASVIRSRKEKGDQVARGFSAPPAAK